MLEEIKELVAESLGTNVEDLTEETSFSDDLNEVKIPTEDLEKIKTIGDVKDYIEEHK